MTNKYTKESINGVEHTVLWNDSLPDGDIEYRGDEDLMNIGGCLIVHWRGDHIATALPPLPRKPTAKDARLLHLYASFGLRMYGELYESDGEPIDSDCLVEPRWFGLYVDNNYGQNRFINDSDAFYIRLTHAITEQGDRVDVPLIDGGV